MTLQISVIIKVKVKVGFLYSAAYAMTGPARCTISEVAVDWQEPMVLQRKLQPSNCTRITYNWTHVMQLANTPPLQSTAPGLHPVSIHQTSPLVQGSIHPITAYYSIYRPRKDERLSRPAWLVTYQNKVPPSGVEPGHVTHPSTNRARRRVTSLILPTLLPLHHAANYLLSPLSDNITFIRCSLLLQTKQHSLDC